MSEFDVRPVVLLADSEESRSSYFVRLLESEFSAKTQLAKTWEELMAFIVLIKTPLSRPRLPLGPIRHPHLVLFAEDLRISPIAPWTDPLPQRFHELMGATRGTSIRLGCLGDLTAESLLTIDRAHHLVLSVPAGMEYASIETNLIKELERAFPVTPRKPDVDLEASPGIVMDPENDPSGLALQVRFLTDERTLKAGKDLLAAIVRDFFRPERVKIRPLGQGLSGATVFWIQPLSGGRSLGDFALKLAPMFDLRKIRHEIAGHEKATKTLNHADLRFYFPDIVLPKIRGDHRDHVVLCKSWCAICYRLLGGDEVGQFMDLEAALLENASRLQERIDKTEWANRTIADVRQHSLNCVLGALRKLWYQHPHHSERVLRSLWAKDELADEGEPPVFPPYGFTGKQRKAILAFLEGNALGLGPRLLENWAVLKKAVKDVVLGDRLSEITKLDRNIVVLLSPCHGDLNGKNAMLWLDHQNHPFLIDFPSFQEKGHALQDFARLEVEIKFAILDRHDIPEAPRAWDHTDAQMEVWRALDDHVLPSNPDVPLKMSWALTKPGLSTASPELCLGFLQTLRQHAVDTQRHPPGSNGPTFYEEYLPALLYHTIRVVRYDSYSVFKRILAVRSAARIIEWLR